MGKLMHPLPPNQQELTPHITTGPLTEVHRTPDGRETCTGGLRLDLATMTATCPLCGRVFGVTRAEPGAGGVG